MRMTVHESSSRPARPRGVVSVTGRRLLAAGVMLAVGVTAAACSSSSPAKTSSASGSSGSSAGSAPTSVSFAYLGASAGLMPEVLMASNPSMCATYGVSPKMQIIQQATAPAALAAGKIQALRSGTGSFLIASSQQPTETTIVGAFGPLPLSLFVTKSIKSISDLKGTTVGAPAKGSTSDVAIRELLAEHGLTVGKDVKITYAGSSSALFGEAASGAIQGFLYSPPVPAVAGSTGVHELLSTAGIPAIDNLNKTVIGVTSSFLKSKPDAVKGLLACLKAAAGDIVRDPSHAASVLAKAEQVTQDQAAAQIQAQISAGSYKEIAFTADDATSVIDELQKFGVAQFGSFNPASVIDNTLLPSS
jgi:NitT/TauT family transport system substrate-binding protein